MANSLMALTAFDEQLDINTAAGTCTSPRCALQKFCALAQRQRGLAGLADLRVLCCGQSAHGLTQLLHEGHHGYLCDGRVSKS